MKQAEHWNDRAGPRWVRHTEQLDAQLGPIGRAAMDRAGIGRGQRVIDVGCGAGGSTLDLARRVGPTGHVLGVDVSRTMLDGARRRLGEQPLAQVALLEADAQTHGFERARADHVFSRFGLMFFSDTVAALTNLRRALAPEGRLTFVCWDVLTCNPWMCLPREVAARHVELPEPPEAYEPGPFRFADTTWVGDQLLSAGFARPEVVPLEGRLLLGGPTGTLDSAVKMVQCVGPAAEALVAVPAAVRHAFVEDMRRAFEEFVDGDGVRVPYRAFCISAERSSARRRDRRGSRSRARIRGDSSR